MKAIELTELTADQLKAMIADVDEPLDNVTFGGEPVDNLGLEPQRMSGGWSTSDLDPDSFNVDRKFKITVGEQTASYVCFVPQEYAARADHKVVFAMVIDAEIHMDSGEYVMGSGVGSDYLDCAGFIIYLVGVDKDGEVVDVDCKRIWGRGISTEGNNVRETEGDLNGDYGVVVPWQST